jgi:hypothetical protein
MFRKYYRDLDEDMDKYFSGSEPVITKDKAGKGRDDENETKNADADTKRVYDSWWSFKKQYRDLDEDWEEMKKRMKNKGKGKNSYNYRGRERESGRERDRESPLHVVCVDNSKGAQRAMKYALDVLPKKDRLVLVHGHHRWNTRKAGTRVDEEDQVGAETIDLENRYLEMCRNSGRECRFLHFNYTTYNNFGDSVCRLAQFKKAKTVFIGRRQNVTDMRRAFLGSASQSVLNYCSTPVNIVTAE